jgi:hypothetical protein
MGAFGYNVYPYVCGVDLSFPCSGQPIRHNFLLYIRFLRLFSRRLLKIPPDSAVYHPLQGFSLSQAEFALRIKRPILC